MPNYSISTFHSDSWNCTFSNLPTITNMADISMFDHYVKTLSIPDYTMEEIYSEYKDFRIRHPVAPKINNNLGQLVIEFKLTEDMANYLNLFEYMRQLKYGELSDSFTDEFIRKYTVKSIILSLNDNQKRQVANIRFTEAFLLSLGSISLTTGVAEEITFATTWSYQELLYERKSIYVGGGDGTQC